MDESVLDKAKLRLDAIEREADELRAFIRMYVKLAEPQHLAKPVAAEHIKSDLKFYGGGDAFSTRHEIIEAARDILKRVHPRPLIISDLFQALVDRGIKINGQNPKGNLSAKLSQPEDIVYVKDEGWYYRPQGDEDLDELLGGGTPRPSANATQARGREAVPGGGP